MRTLFSFVARHMSQGSTKLSQNCLTVFLYQNENPVDHMIHGIFVLAGFSFWYKKTVMPKKKYIAARDLKDCLPNLPL
jgi:hypothetical protein